MGLVCVLFLAAGCGEPDCNCAISTGTWSTHAPLSLGTYSILTQIDLAAHMGLDWVYLGLAIRENHSMAYKLAFMPHERRIGGVWRRFARASSDADPAPSIREPPPASG